MTEADGLTAGLEWLIILAVPGVGQGTDFRSLAQARVPLQRGVVQRLESEFVMGVMSWRMIGRDK